MVLLRGRFYSKAHLRDDAKEHDYSNIAGKGLSWALIQAARQSGSDYYDFGGVRKKEQPGIYQYKNGSLQFIYQAIL